MLQRILLYYRFNKNNMKKREFPIDQPEIDPSHGNVCNANTKPIVYIEYTSHQWLYLRVYHNQNIVFFQ